MPKLDSTSKIGRNRSVSTGLTTTPRWRGERGWLATTCMLWKVSLSHPWETASSGSRTNSQTTIMILELIARKGKELAFSLLCKYDKWFWCYMNDVLRRWFFVLVFYIFYVRICNIWSWYLFSQMKCVFSNSKIIFFQKLWETVLKRSDFWKCL